MIYIQIWILFSLIIIFAIPTDAQLYHLFVGSENNLIKVQELHGIMFLAQNQKTFCKDGRKCYENSCPTNHSHDKAYCSLENSTKVGYCCTPATIDHSSCDLKHFCAESSLCSQIHNRPVYSEACQTVDDRVTHICCPVLIDHATSRDAAPEISPLPVAKDAAFSDNIISLDEYNTVLHNTVPRVSSHSHRSVLSGDATSRSNLTLCVPPATCLSGKQCRVASVRGWPQEQQNSRNRPVSQLPQCRLSELETGVCCPVNSQCPSNQLCVGEGYCHTTNYVSTTKLSGYLFNKDCHTGDSQIGTCCKLHLLDNCGHVQEDTFALSVSGRLPWKSQVMSGGKSYRAIRISPVHYLISAHAAKLIKKNSAYIRYKQVTRYHSTKKRLEIHTINIHPDYNATTYMYDVAVLSSSTAVSLNHSVSSLCVSPAAIETLHNCRAFHYSTATHQHAIDHFSLKRCNWPDRGLHAHTQPALSLLTVCVNSTTCSRHDGAAVVCRSGHSYVLGALLNSMLCQSHRDLSAETVHTSAGGAVYDFIFHILLRDGFLLA